MESKRITIKIGKEQVQVDLDFDEEELEECDDAMMK